MNPMLNIAIKAIRSAGNFLIQKYVNYTKLDINNITKSSLAIANINRSMKLIIMQVIQKYYPNHIFIKNKYKLHFTKSNNTKWVINSLDGVDNFIRKFPHFSISIAAIVNGRSVISLIYDPIRNDLFSAVRGNGAQLNSFRIRSNSICKLENIVLALSLKSKLNNDIILYKKVLNKLINSHIDFRYTGSSSLDLAYLAAGKIDGYLQVGFNYFDFISNELLLIESGNILSDFIGKSDCLLFNNVICGNPRLLKELLILVKE
ncbi:inositol monophosphatase [Candidatus Purcelliella pentastirinorum]|uniref:Inositol monophosphatase n=1 Tax=Candidatus Purcelliella pentastirinorum TaxID=472834 RepID=A0AAX3N875_9ENTR|nr:inositol monophosphatase family protein [Candidatus Purcelliella pentastirinorum]WDI78649.1 inositol monophosphatase [Candidatus Purcelliella pentastirinorum]WDR80323.1 inositol monophosphatase [Candidatus Purcelliella pentastirinorum]